MALLGTDLLAVQDGASKVLYRVEASRLRTLIPAAPDLWIAVKRGASAGAVRVGALRSSDVVAVTRPGVGTFSCMASELLGSGVLIGAVTITGVAVTPGPGYDPDAAAYIAAVEAADGQPLEDGVKEAMNDLVVALKANNIWEGLDRFATLAGPRTVAGCMIPLRGSTMFVATNVTAGDYRRKDGFRSKDGAWISITQAGWDPDPLEGKIAISVLATEPVVAPDNWAGGFVNQDQYPDQRTTIAISPENNIAVYGARSTNESAATPLTRQYNPAFYLVARTSATEVEVHDGSGTARTIAQPYAPAIAGLGAVIAGGGSVGQRFMCCSAGLTITHIADSNAFEAACRNYHLALATAIP